MASSFRAAGDPGSRTRYSCIYCEADTFEAAEELLEHLEKKHSPSHGRLALEVDAKLRRAEELAEAGLVTEAALDAARKDLPDDPEEALLAVRAQRRVSAAVAEAGPPREHVVIRTRSEVEAEAEHRLGELMCELVLVAQKLPMKERNQAILGWTIHLIPSPR